MTLRKSAEPLILILLLPPLVLALLLLLLPLLLLVLPLFTATVCYDAQPDSKWLLRPVSVSEAPSSHQSTQIVVPFWCHA